MYFILYFTLLSFPYHIFINIIPPYCTVLEPMFRGLRTWNSKGNGSCQWICNLKMSGFFYWTYLSTSLFEFWWNVYVFLQKCNDTASIHLFPQLLKVFLLLKKGNFQYNEPFQPLFRGAASAGGLFSRGQMDVGRWTRSLNEWWNRKLNEWINI